MSEKVKFKDITINLDKRRKPLNGADREKISKQKLYPYCGANNIMDYVDEYLFDEEILCIAEDGGKWGKNEICSYIMNEKCWVNNHAHVIKVKENVDIRYLKHWLNYSNLNSYITGAIVRKLTQKELNELEIVLPSKDEQRKIADKIDKVQNIIEIKMKQVEKLNELIKSQFVEMFGDPILNEKNWIKVPLGKECNIITGNTPSRNKKEYYGDFIEWIKSDNINTPSNYITQAEEYLSEEGESVGRTIKEDSILMTCIAGSIGCIGNVAMTDRKVAFNQQINGIETLKHNTIFMYVQFLLSKKYIQSTVNMSLKGILSKGKLAELEFIFPPIDLQNQFAEIVKQIDKQKLEIQKSLEEMQTLKNGLINKHF